uniref:Midkine n=1 Tax=Moschus moschiferus TaxID=68415 RepID=A0A8C6D6I7_MOSMO
MQRRSFLLLALLALLALTSAVAKKKADCKYKFETWGACDGGTGTKARQGTLKKARYNAQCQETIRVTKPCSAKTKAKTKAKKGKEKD